MKRDFRQMSKAELRAYVLQHCKNDEALRVLMDRYAP